MECEIYNAFAGRSLTARDLKPFYKPASRSLSTSRPPKDQSILCMPVFQI